MRYDTSKLDQSLVKQARKGSKWDHNDQKRYDALLKAKQQQAKPAPAPAPKPAPTPKPEFVPVPTTGREPKPAPSPTPTPTGMDRLPSIPKPSGTNSQQQLVNQNNDINSDVTGNNNIVDNIQDNSVRQNDGDNRSQIGNVGSTEPNNQTSVKPSPARTEAKQRAQVVKQQTEVKNVQEQTVTQDNDINTNITGDNNKVFNEQDNSIRQYGGDNRTLVINDSGKGSKGYYNSADKAITMGTLGGFYDVDDSPAAQAKFVDQQQTMNRDAQKKYSNVGITTANKYAGFRGGNIDIKALQGRIDGNEQYFRDRATIQEVKTYGDRAAKFEYKPFEFGDPIEQIESNAGKIAKGYKDDIDDL